MGKEEGYLESYLGGTRDDSDSIRRLYWLDLIDRTRRFKAPLLSAVIDPGIDPQISSKNSHLMVYEILYGRADSILLASDTLTLSFFATSAQRSEETQEKGTDSHTDPKHHVPTSRAVC